MLPKPILAFSCGRTQCWIMDGEFYVYASEKLVQACRSIGMAREVAAGL